MRKVIKRFVGKQRALGEFMQKKPEAQKARPISTTARKSKEKRMKQTARASRERKCFAAKRKEHKAEN